MELSLFPLHVVLFPGMALPLHIFEERYKLMIRRCLDEDATFGVVLIREGSEVGAPAVPHLVGTRARMVDAERLPDGRINLLTIGEERFQIAHYWEEDGTLRGNVTFFEDEADASPERLTELARCARRLLIPYLTATVGTLNLQQKDLPVRDALSLSFWAASLLSEPTPVRQALLEMTSTVDRLQRTIELMERYLFIRRLKPSRADAMMWDKTVLSFPVFLN